MSRILEARLSGAPGVSVKVDVDRNIAHGFAYAASVPEELRAAIESGALGTDGTGPADEVFSAASIPLDQLAALGERAGRDLLRYTASSPPTFAKSDSGPTILRDVDVLKLGTFKGYTFGEGELRALVDNFETLRDSSIFVPPVRLDHGWSILGVIGYVDELRLATAPDPTAGGAENLYLRADLRITEPDAVELIRRGTAVNRSSEFGPYLTNLGLEFALIFYGVAFVDIPAVEGLAPIKLRAGFELGEPHSVTALDEGISAMSGSTTTTGPAVTAASTGATGALSQTDADGATGATGPEGEPDGAGATGEASSSTDGSTATATATTAPPAAATGSEPQGSGDATGAGGTSAADSAGELAADHPAAVALRQAQETLRETLRTTADAQLVAFRASGAVVPGNEASARTLLSHEDRAVREAAAGLLGFTRPPVELGAERGSTASTSGDSVAGSGGNGGAEKIKLSMSEDQVAEVWSSLSTEERTKYAHERDAWLNAQ